MITYVTQSHWQLIVNLENGATGATVLHRADLTELRCELEKSVAIRNAEEKRATGELSRAGRATRLALMEASFRMGHVCVMQAGLELVASTVNINGYILGST